MSEQILIKKISLKNFRGIAAGEHEFAENDFIHGAFGSGKSSFYNAYKWVLGLNVDFAPNIAGKKIKGIETAVEVVMIKNFGEYAFRREAKQTWKVEPDGTQRFDKYKYAYFYNGVELKPKEYAERVLDFFELSNENELNMAIDFQYFNRTAEPKWNAEKRRAYLFDLFGIAAKTEELCKTYPLIYGDLYGAKLTQEQLRKGIKAKRDAIKAEISCNMSLIETALAKINEFEKIDFDGIEKAIQSKWDEIKALTQDTQAEQVMKKAGELAESIARLRIAKSKTLEKAAAEEETWQKCIRAAQKEMGDIHTKIMCCNDDIKTRDDQIDTLEIDKTQLEETQFDEQSAICPVCRRKLAPTTIEKKKAYFEEEKAKKLKAMAEQKAWLESGIAEVSAKKSELETELAGKKAEYEKLVAGKPDEADTEKIDKTIETLSAELSSIRETTPTDRAERVAEIRSEISDLAAELAHKEHIATLQKDIENRKADNVKLSNSDAELIRQKAQLDEFSIKEIELAESVINQSFGGVKFNFLAELGGASEQGVRKTCIATYQGIEYDKLSGGQQIICDYLVSKSLREINGWKYPQWTDEVCRVSNSIDRLQEVFDFDINDWQNIVLLTDDYAKLPVEYLKGA